MTEFLLELNRPDYDYESNFITYFAELYLKDTLVDVTLVSTEGTLTRAHRLVLSASSNYFQKLFDQIQSKHPVVVLKDVEHEDIQKILLFMYKGTIKVESQERVERFLLVAESFKLKGLENLRIEKCINKESGPNLEMSLTTLPRMVQPNYEAGGICKVTTADQLMHQVKGLEGVPEQSNSKTLNPQPLPRSLVVRHQESESELIIPVKYNDEPSISSVPDSSISSSTSLPSAGTTMTSRIQSTATAAKKIPDPSILPTVISFSECSRPNFIKIEDDVSLICNRFEDESCGEYMEMDGDDESSHSSECLDGNRSTALISGGIVVTEFQMPETEGGGGDQKKFTCKQCGLNFKQWPNLWRHMKTHDTGNLIKCDFCPKTYARIDSLRKHVLVSHGKLSQAEGNKRGLKR